MTYKIENNNYDGENGDTAMQGKERMYQRSYTEPDQDIHSAANAH